MYSHKLQKDITLVADDTQAWLYMGKGWQSVYTRAEVELARGLPAYDLILVDMVKNLYRGIIKEVKRV